jgi:hypothetical protein
VVCDRAAGIAAKKNAIANAAGNLLNEWASGRASRLLMQVVEDAVPPLPLG